MGQMFYIGYLRLKSGVRSEKKGQQGDGTSGFMYLSEENARKIKNKILSDFLKQNK